MASLAEASAPPQRSLAAHLRRGVIIPTVAVILILLLVILFGAGMVVQDIIHYQTLLIHTLARQGEQYLAETDRLLLTLAGASVHLEPAAQRRLLAETRRAYSQFTALYLLDADGVVLMEDTAAIPLLGLDLSGERFFQQVFHSGQAGYSEPFISLATEKVSVTGATPVFVEGEFRGMVVGELNLELLQDAIDQVNLGPGAVSFIVDQRGTLIAHPTPTWVQQRRNLGDVPLVQVGLAGDAGFELFYDPHTAGWWVGSVTRMGPEWLVLTTQPALVVVRPLLILGGLAAVGILLSFSIFFWFQVRTFRQTTYPITLLAEKAEALARGEYRQPLPLEAFGHYQELTSLGQSFAQMAQAVQERTAQLEQELQERQLAEQALRESEARYRVLLETLPDSVVLADLDGHLITANVQTALLYGYEDVETLQASGQELYHFLTPESQARAQAMRRSVLARGSVRNVEYTARRGDGSTFPIEWSAARVADAVGRPQAIVSITRDITERKRAEAEVARWQQLLQSITDSMPSALITLDPEGRVMTWNPAASRVVGSPVCVQQILWECCPRLSPYRVVFEQVIRTGQEVQRHREPWGAGPPFNYYDFSLFPLRAEGLAGVVLRIDDVTRRVQLEEMMLQAAKMASLGGLAAGVAHEINNPLAVMMQSAQVLHLALDVERESTRARLAALGIDPTALGHYLAARRVAEYLVGIRETGARAAKIVADLLSFSRQRAFQARPQDLNELVTRTLALASTDYDLKKRYDFRDMVIETHLAEQLPQVVCDGQQIQQVILNLVRNAAQAMSEKLAAHRDTVYQPRLRLTTLAQAQWARLLIEDNGPGLSESAAAHLFEPFFTTKEVGTGTGLGLWLCWSIVVERHQGQIWAESNAEGGATFGIELLVAHPASEDGE